MTQPAASNLTYSAHSVASLPQALQEQWIASLTNDQLRYLKYDWQFWARSKQLPPSGDWRIWLVLAGRGFGKTRTINEWACAQAKLRIASRGAIVGRTAADVRDVLVEGESGILNISPPWFLPNYEPSKRRLTWPNGTTATLFSADEPRLLRGPQFHWAIADELAHWRHVKEAWDMLMLGLRLGHDPRCAVATTPRPIRLLKDLMHDATVHVTRGTTYENRANLAATFFTQIVNRYEGTRLGRQEIGGEVLEDNPDALWHRESMIDPHRVAKPPELTQIGVAVDPPTSVKGEAGIVIGGTAIVDGLPHLYTLDDRSCSGTPAHWASEAVAAYHKWDASFIVAERNQGGDMVEHTIRTVDGGRDVMIKLVHASRGKRARAEPVASLYQQGRGHHVGTFADLEDELCQWDGTGASPNRLDALVWLGTELIIDKQHYMPQVAMASVRLR